MAFPDVPRVFYRLSPLEEVICQIQFPPVLRIDAEAPVGFQEAVRSQYPFYETRAASRIPVGLPPELAQIFSTALPVGPKSHEFASRDRNWVVKLGSQFLALTCRTYDRWEGFSARMSEAAAALVGQFSPAFYTRLGLRYRNVVRRSRLPEKNQLWEWNELIQPWLTGPLGPPETANRVEETRTTSVFALDDGAGRCILNHGLAVDAATQEQVFAIDADCFTEDQTEPGDALHRLDTLHRQAHLLFRWCITERLHDALGPQPIG